MRSHKLRNSLLDNKLTHAYNWSVTIYTRFFERYGVLKDEISGYWRATEEGNMWCRGDGRFKVANNQLFEGVRTLLNRNGM